MNSVIIMNGLNPDLTMSVEYNDSGYDIFLLGEVISSYNKYTRKFIDIDIPSFISDHADWIFDEPAYNLNYSNDPMMVDNNIVMITDETGKRVNMYDYRADFASVNDFENLVNLIKSICSVYYLI